MKYLPDSIFVAIVSLALSVNSAQAASVPADPSHTAMDVPAPQAIPPSPATLGAVKQQGQVPIRLRRRKMVTAERTFNHMAGYSATVGYQFTRHLALDLNVGFEEPKHGKAGLRLRMNLAHGPISPFFSLGSDLIAASRHDHPADHGATLRPWAMATGMGGLSAVHHSGITFLAGVGLATRVSKQSTPWAGGQAGAVTPGSSSSTVFKNAAVMNVALGYAF